VLHGPIGVLVNFSDGTTRVGPPVLNFAASLGGAEGADRLLHESREVRGLREAGHKRGAFSMAADSR